MRSGKGIVHVVEKWKSQTVNDEGDPCTFINLLMKYSCISPSVWGACHSPEAVKKGLGKRPTVACKDI